MKISLCGLLIATQVTIRRFVMENSVEARVRALAISRKQPAKEAKQQAAKKKKAPAKKAPKKDEFPPLQVGDTVVRGLNWPNYYKNEDGGAGTTGVVMGTIGPATYTQVQVKWKGKRKPAKRWSVGD